MEKLPSLKKCLHLFLYTRWLVANIHGYKICYYNQSETESSQYITKGILMEHLLFCCVAKINTHMHNFNSKDADYSIQ